MGSVSVSHLILFIASLLVAVSIAGTLVFEVGQMSSAIETQGSAVTEEIETDIAIISDPGQSEAIYDGSEVTVIVKNIGSRNIPADSSGVEILIDGRYISSENIDVEQLGSESSAWRPEGVVEITIDGEDDLDGDTEVAVIVTGNEDTIDFNA